MQLADSDIRNRLLVARLPMMPQVLLRLIEQCQAEGVGMKVLADLVAKDPGLVSRILGVANSSAYHRDGRKVGLEQSLAALGTDMIKTLVINESVFQVFNNFSHSNSIDLRVFWKHSLSAAVIAREIAVRMGYSHVEEAYLAGLLHDVGRLALLATAPKEYARNFLARDDEKLCAVEQSTLTITHSEAGAWLIERWNLDSFLADSVLYHHESVSRLETAHPLVRIVLLAHLLSEYQEDDPGVKAAGVLCGIDAADLALIRDGARAQVNKVAEYLGIDLAGVDEIEAPSAVLDDAELHADVDKGKELSVSAIHGSSVSPDDNVQKQLTEEVRNLMLASEAGRTFSKQREESGLLESVTRSARILFDFEDVVVLLMNDTGQALFGVPVGEYKHRLKEFSISLSGGGMLVEAVLQRRTLFVSKGADRFGIAEEQLLRVLNSESLVCLPLYSEQSCRGVMICGVASWQLPSLQRRERLLRTFGEQVAFTLDAMRSKSGEALRRVANVADEFKESTRRVVHEVNNPLSIIKNYLGVLGSKLERQEPVVGEISILNEEIDRVGSIINGFSDLKLTMHEGGVEVNRIVNDVVHLFQNTKFVPASIKIFVKTQDIPFEVEGNADALKQILVNLVKNAIEAMPSGGKIHLSNNGYVNRDGRLYTELCVSDSGPGISSETLSSLYSPVRSTKGNGHQGLGLSIVHNLVNKTQGLITCRSGNKGTSFEILLPVRKRTSQVEPSRATS